jgi:hypothetical protein
LDSNWRAKKRSRSKEVWRQAVKTIIVMLFGLLMTAQAQNLVDEKVTWVSPLITWNTGIIQYNLSICNGRMVPGQFSITLDAHNDQPNYGTYVGNWVGSSTEIHPTATRVYLSDNTYVTWLHDELVGTFTPTNGTPISNVHAWFSDIVVDTSYGNNYALGCGEVSVILAPNG